MDIEGLGPDLRLTPEGAAAVPRPAATVLLLRGGAGALEVLLVRRSPGARVMGGVWVFPGGTVDADEGEGDLAQRAAAVRELAEETGVVGVDPAALVRFSRWVTPPVTATRFDTHFFLAAAPPGARARADGVECVEARWFTPQGALDAHRGGEILLVFPTIKHLEQIAPFAGADELLAHARERRIRPVEPRVVISGETARVLLPGEPGYDEAPPPGA